MALVSDRFRRLGPLPAGTLGAHAVRPDLGLLRPLGMGSLSLRQVGARSPRLVLAAGLGMGSGLGFLELWLQLGRLVSAELLRLPRVRLLRVWLLRVWLLRVWLLRIRRVRAGIRRPRGPAGNDPWEGGAPRVRRRSGFLEFHRSGGDRPAGLPQPVVRLQSAEPGRRSGSVPGSHPGQGFPAARGGGHCDDPLRQVHKPQALEFAGRHHPSSGRRRSRRGGSRSQHPARAARGDPLKRSAGAQHTVDVRSGKGPRHPGPRSGRTERDRSRRGGEPVPGHCSRPGDSRPLDSRTPDGAPRGCPRPGRLRR